jgi:hypothetical protein
LSLIGVDPCNSSLHMWLWYEHKLNFLLQFDIEVANCYFVNTNMIGLLFLQNNIISCAFVFSQGFHHLSARNSSAVEEILLQMLNGLSDSMCVVLNWYSFDWSMTDQRRLWNNDLWCCHILLFRTIDLPQPFTRIALNI